jgi:hypothetical protein
MPQDNESGGLRLPGLDMEAEIRGMLEVMESDQPTALDRELERLSSEEREGYIDAQWNALLGEE